VFKHILHVSSHNLNVHFNLSYLYRGLTTFLSGLFKQNISLLAALRVSSDLRHEPVEVDHAIFFDFLNETEPLLIPVAADGLFTVHGAAKDDVFGEPNFVFLPGAWHELLALKDHFKLRPIRFSTHQLHAFFV